MSKKIISYSLYGNKPYYCEGAIKNAKDNFTNYGSEWETWVYVFEDVPVNYIDELKKYANRVIPITHDFPVQNGTIWRFLAIDEPEVDIMLIRDIDSRYTQKEKNLVDEWLKSDKQYHIIRDGFTHQMPFLAGSFGIKKGNGLSIIGLLKRNPQFMKKSSVYIIDQLFLAHCIYPLTVNNRMFMIVLIIMN